MFSIYDYNWFTIFTTEVFGGDFLFCSFLTQKLKRNLYVHLHCRKYQERRYRIFFDFEIFAVLASYLSLLNTECEKLPQIIVFPTFSPLHDVIFPKKRLINCKNNVTFVTLFLRCIYFDNITSINRKNTVSTLRCF